MLKIKDNVDLKELEKFGFKMNNSEWYMKDMEGGNFYIKPLSKEITIKAYNTTSYGNLNIIYDLIQAGIVEKI